MRTSLFTVAAAAAILFSLGCDAVELDDIDAQAFASDDDDRDINPIAAPAIGTVWAPCDLTGVDSDPDWWGCNGEPGEGLACARPLSDQPTSICVPQIGVGGECLAVWDPGYADGIKEVGGAYCVLPCNESNDCLVGQLCSAHGMCAWID